ncbi:MAG TPA: TIGR01777 family oxidoreductase [Bryobacteraceae bacterium]|nr:TIGR01777 family oxidoreductase [Bryobacteraceae bacterium]
MNVTISGASGFIGRRLLNTLARRGHSLHVLSRHAGTNLPQGVRLSVWNPMKGPPPAEALRDADAIVNLAGENVAQRWSAETKQRIRDSRVTGTRNLVEGLSQLDRRPAALVSSSASGYYGSRGDALLDETSAPGAGFLAEVCVEWERAAFSAQKLGMRVAAIRTGLVLDPHGGALQKMLPPFRLGVGGKLGDGRQWLPWIHLDDLVDIYVHAVENTVSGPFNGSAPNPVTNTEFTRELGKAVHRPAIFPVPKLAMHVVFGEMAEVLFDSQRMLPKAAEAAGFRFQFATLGEALRQLLS